LSDLIENLRDCKEMLERLRARVLRATRLDLSGQAELVIRRTLPDDKPSEMTILSGQHVALAIEALLADLDEQIDLIVTELRAKARLDSADAKEHERNWVRHEKRFEGEAAQEMGTEKRRAEREAARKNASKPT
jgi:hypothetical protein